MVIDIQGYEVLIDDEDYTRVKAIEWHKLIAKSNVYFCKNARIRNGKMNVLLLHRFIMNAPVGYDVDHRNCNTLDNRKENLRMCSHAENTRNQKMRSNNTSGYKGVSFNRQVQKWAAQIKLNYKRIHLGYFVTPEEAHLAYCKASKELHGEFGRTI